MHERMEAMADRIVKESAPVGYQDIQNFFDERSARDGVKSKYNYVLFQDNHPELAEQRDAWGKKDCALFADGAWEDGAGSRLRYRALGRVLPSGGRALCRHGRQRGHGASSGG